MNNYTYLSLSFLFFIAPLHAMGCKKTTNKTVLPVAEETLGNTGASSSALPAPKKNKQPLLERVKTPEPATKRTRSTHRPTKLPQEETAASHPADRSYLPEKQTNTDQEATHAEKKPKKDRPNTVKMVLEAWNSMQKMGRKKGYQEEYELQSLGLILENTQLDPAIILNYICERNFQKTWKSIFEELLIARAVQKDCAAAKASLERLEVAVASLIDAGKKRPTTTFIADHNHHTFQPITSPLPDKPNKIHVAATPAASSTSASSPSLTSSTAFTPAPAAQPRPIATPPSDRSLLSPQEAIPNHEPIFYPNKCAAFFLPLSKKLRAWQAQARMAHTS